MTERGYIGLFDENGKELTVNGYERQPTGLFALGFQGGFHFVNTNEINFRLKDPVTVSSFGFFENKVGGHCSLGAKIITDAGANSASGNMLDFVPGNLRIYDGQKEV